MRRSIILVLGLVPAGLTAQQSSGTGVGQSSAATETRGEARVEVQAGFSAEARARIEATLAAAREKNLPPEPIQNRIDEGRAKGASEAAITAAAERTEARMEAVQRAMVRAGREEPRPQEIERGEQAMARGATEAQIEALVGSAPSERSLVVAFDVLSQLEARGVPVDQALAVISAKLEARASDEAIAGLAASARGVGETSANGAAASAPGAAVSATATGALRGPGATSAAVTGAVSGIIRKP
jgi:hypothetical protein